LAASDQLNQLAIRARQLAAIGQLQAARDLWAAALPHLPESRERDGVVREIERLDARIARATVNSSAVGPPRSSPLRNLIFPLSMLAFVGVFWSLMGPLFAVGLTLSVLLHELGHYFTIKRFGFQPELPIFLPIGAFVRWRGQNVDPAARSLISLAGPLMGFVSGIIAFGAWRLTGHHVWLAVAEYAGFINLLNLIPLSIFDGGGAMSALGTQQRAAVLAAGIAFFFVLHDWVFLAIAVGALIRLRTPDLPANPRSGIAIYFIALAAANGLLSWYCLHQGVRLLPGLSS
jgi:Zn-dependent protease